MTSTNTVKYQPTRSGHITAMCKDCFFFFNTACNSSKNDDDRISSLQSQKL